MHGLVFHATCCTGMGGECCSNDGVAAEALSVSDGCLDLDAGRKP